MLRFHKTTHLSLLLKFILSERLSNSLWGSDLLLFSEFINIVSILFYNLIEFIILLNIFFSNFFGSKYIWFVWFHLVSFQMCDLYLLVQEIGNLWSTCLGVNIFNLVCSKTLAKQAKDAKLTYLDVSFLVFILLEIFHFWNH